MKTAMKTEKKTVKTVKKTVKKTVMKTEKRTLLSNHYHLNHCLGDFHQEDLPRGMSRRLSDFCNHENLTSLYIFIKIFSHCLIYFVNVSKTIRFCISP